jgi:hypothetical protein
MALLNKAISVPSIICDRMISPSKVDDAAQYSPALGITAALTVRIADMKLYVVVGNWRLSHLKRGKIENLPTDRTAVQAIVRLT